MRNVLITAACLVALAGPAMADPLPYLTMGGSTCASVGNNPECQANEMKMAYVSWHRTAAMGRGRRRNPSEMRRQNRDDRRHDSLLGRSLNMRTLITAAALVAIAGPAEASTFHTWYLANTHTGQCELTTWTPQVYANMLGAGRIPDKNVYKDSNGIIGVMVDWGGDKVTWFYTSMKECEVRSQFPKPAPEDLVN
jgi:hypothetical protein